MACVLSLGCLCMSERYHVVWMGRDKIENVAKPCQLVSIFVRSGQKHVNSHEWNVRSCTSNSKWNMQISMTPHQTKYLSFFSSFSPLNRSVNKKYNELDVCYETKAVL